MPPIEKRAPGRAEKDMGQAGKGTVACQLGIPIAVFAAPHNFGANPVSTIRRI
jgi:hypothetical protein